MNYPDGMTQSDWDHVDGISRGRYVDIRERFWEDDPPCSYCGESAPDKTVETDEGYYEYCLTCDTLLYEEEF